LSLGVERAGTTTVAIKTDIPIAVRMVVNATTGPTADDADAAAVDGIARLACRLEGRAVYRCDGI